MCWASRSWRPARKQGPPSYSRVEPDSADQKRVTTWADSPQRFQVGTQASTFISALGGPEQGNQPGLLGLWPWNSEMMNLNGFESLNVCQFVWAATDCFVGAGGGKQFGARVHRGLGLLPLRARSLHPAQPASRKGTELRLQWYLFPEQKSVHLRSPPCGHSADER